MKVQEKLKQFQLERKAILATNFYNYETLKGILEAASQVQAPVMLQLTKRVGAMLPRCRIRVGNDRCQRKEYGGEYRNDL